MASNFPGSGPDLPPGGGSTLPPVASGMVGRIKRLIASPRTEWPLIAAEPMTTKELFLRWALPLAAIGPVCSLIGQQLFGINLGFVKIQPSLAASLQTSITSYILALVGVWVMSFVVDALAPNFGGVKNSVAATKLAVFSYVPVWLVGVVGLVPILAILGIVGLYSFFLFWIGLPILMRPLPEKVGVYAASVIGAMIVIMLIGVTIVSRLSPVAGPTATTLTSGQHSITITGN